MPKHHLRWQIRVLSGCQLGKRVISEDVISAHSCIAAKQKVALPLTLKNPDLGTRFVASAIIDGAPPSGRPLNDFELKAIRVTHKAAIPLEGIFICNHNRHRNDVQAVWQIRVHIVNCGGHGVCGYFRADLAVENGTDFGIIDVSSKS